VRAKRKVRALGEGYRDGSSDEEMEEPKRHGAGGGVVKTTKLVKKANIPGLGVNIRLFFQRCLEFLKTPCF